MWSLFLNDHNGISIIPDQFWTVESELQLFIDACKSIGFGGYLQGKWFQGKWPTSTTKAQSIAWKEFFPNLVAVILWGNVQRGKRIILRTDNSCVVAILNKQTSKCPQIMKLVLFFVLQCLKCNLSFHAKHIPGTSVVSGPLSTFLNIHEVGVVKMTLMNIHEVKGQGRVTRSIEVKRHFRSLEVKGHFRPKKNRKFPKNKIEHF